jgi:hypothetical protein
MWLRLIVRLYHTFLLSSSEVLLEFFFNAIILSGWNMYSVFENYLSNEAWEIK